MPRPCGFYYYNLVVQLEIQNGDTSTFIIQDWLSIPVLVCVCACVFPHEAEHCPFKIFKELC